MTKIFIPFVLFLATSLVACQQNAKTNDSTATTEEQTQTSDSISEATKEEEKSDLPKFSSPEVQQFAEEYATYVNESMEAAKSGNAAKIQELATKAQEWATKAQEFSSKMTADDAQLWVDYQSKLAEKLTNP